MSCMIGLDVTFKKQEFHQLYPIMIDWCLENIGHENWEWSVLDTTSKTTIWFYNEEDATAFKLRFGL